MTTLKVKLSTGKGGKGEKLIYQNKVSAKNFREVALVLEDLKNLDIPIERSFKEMKIQRSDWERSLFP